MGIIGYNIKLQMLLLLWEVVMKNKDKWELSALVYSRSLDEWTAVESQSVDITILFFVLKAAS